MATIKKGLRKAKDGAKTTTTENTKKPINIKVDKNTTEQKAKLDNKYNQIYTVMQKDSTDFSNNVSLPAVYNYLRKKNSKSPSAEELRSKTDELNKLVVTDSKANRGNTRLDAKGRTENAMNRYKNGGSAKKKMKSGGTIKKAKDGDLLDKVSKTKLKDVPAKAKRFGRRVIEKGKKLVSDTVEKVKNTTVGDAAKTVRKVAFGFKHGGVVKKKMRNGGSLSGLKASNKRAGSEKGAWITVQNKALAGATSKAKLTKDKQLGATKMTAKFGAKMSKGKSC